MAQRLMLMRSIGQMAGWHSSVGVFKKAMQEKKQPPTGPAALPEKKDCEQPQVPLSATILNAHAAGDGAMEREKETLLEPEADEKDPRDNDTDKGPAQY